MSIRSFIKTPNIRNIWFITFSAMILFVCMSSSANAQISNITVTHVSYTSALIKWSTSVSATGSHVEYDSTRSTTPFAYSTIKKTSPGFTQHGVSLGGLAPNTRYYFRACSTSGTETCSSVGQFTTIPAPINRFDPPILPNSPELLPMPVINGQKLNVASDCSDLQAVLNQAASITNTDNHEILISPSAVCTGNYTLPARSGSGWIVVRSSASDSQLPAEGVRISPAYEGVMPTLKVGSISRNGVIFSENTSKWRFVGLHFTSDPKTDRISLARILPGTADIVFDRNIFDFEGLVGTPDQRQDAFGLWLRGARMVAANNYIRIIALNSIAYAIEPTYAQGLTIDNNYINAPGISIFGEAGDGHNTCSDVRITRNLFEWDMSYQSEGLVVRQHIEFKAVKRILIKGNVIRHQWFGNITGVFSNPILFSPRNIDSDTPIVDSENEIHDVTIDSNIFYDVPGGISVMGTEKSSVAIDVPATKRVLIKNNLFYDFNAQNYTYLRGSPFYFGRPIEDIVVEHNTVFNPRGDRPWIIYWSDNRGAGLKVLHNILGQNLSPYYSPGLYFGMDGVGLLPPVPSGDYTLLDMLHSAIHASPNFDPTMEYTSNLIVPGVTNSINDANYDNASYNLSTGTCQNYWASVPGNLCAGNDATMDTANERFASVGFVGPLTSPEGFELANNSPYKGWGTTDGSDPGVNMDILMAAIEGILADTTPPVRSNGQPTGVLPDFTTGTVVSLDTNENATCRYSTSSGISYQSMTGHFNEEESAHHSFNLPLSGVGTYRFYVRCIDIKGNANTNDYLISFNVGLYNDVEPPSAITDLNVSFCTPDSCVLTWTAPGDDGNVGTAVSYDIRYSTAPIDGANFDSALKASILIAPKSADQSEAITLTGLSQSTRYYFAIKAADEVPNVSAISNVVSAITQTDDPSKDNGIDPQIDYADGISVTGGCGNINTSTQMNLFLALLLLFSFLALAYRRV